jgi:hypothetical protein
MPVIGFYMTFVSKCISKLLGWLTHCSPQIDCPRAGSGRGIVHGRVSIKLRVNAPQGFHTALSFKMFTRDGVLIAVTTQEGVVRANIRGPSEAKPAEPKL